MAVLEVYSDRWEVWANEKDREDQNGKKKKYIDNYKKKGTSAVTGSIKVPPSWSGYEGMEIIFFNLSIHSNFLQRKELIKEKWDIHWKQGMSIWTFIKKIKAISSSNHIKLQI